MDPTAFFTAALVGLSIAAPVGPIGLLTIQRSLQQGAAAGFATGLGAAAADAVYGAVGAFGVACLIDALNAARLPLAVFGGAFLSWMAWGLWRAEAPEQTAQGAPDAGGLLRCFAGTFVLTLSNPSTVLSFIAIFGAMAARLQAAPPWLMVLGVFTGSAAWWLVLSQGVGRFRGRFDARWRRRVNRVSAVALAAIAVWQVLALLTD